MDSYAILLLSVLVFLPALATLVVALLPSNKPDVLRFFTLGVTLVVLAISVLGFMTGGSTAFNPAKAELQNTFNLTWIPTFDIEYFLGLDGISFPLVMLTAFVSVLAMGASWSIKKHVKAYCILFLLLETGMIGVFMALDFFLFYVFWEVMLLPMYFLIGVWGGPRKEYAAIKFFLYTLLGSVLMLVAILMLYFSSDLADPALEARLDRCHLGDKVVAKVAAEKSRRIAGETARPVHTFNIMAMQQIGQWTNQFDNFGVTKDGAPRLLLGKGMQWWAFLLLFIGFAIKVPSVPVHTWLPDAHVEAPTPISMILAGVLLKMGGYGIIRICYPICPQGGYELANFVCTLGVVSMIYGAFAAIAQKDFKRMVAYSSVSHMGYVVLGLGVWSASKYNGFNPDYWNQGVQGAMFQMIGHGVSSAGMFFMVGIIYDRVHHRNLEEFGGLFGKMPVYTAMAMGLFFAALGLPGLCGFPGEVFVVMSVWKYSMVLAVAAAAVVVLTAVYILWAMQRVYLGAEYKGPHAEELHDTTLRENLIGMTLLVFAIFFGVAPYTVLKYMEKTVEQQVGELSEWTKRVHPGTDAPKTAEAEASKVSLVTEVPVSE